MPWSIKIEAENAQPEKAGEPFGDLEDAIIYALDLADSLGMIAPELRSHKVNIYRDDDQLEFSISVIPGGLSPP